MTTPPDDPTEPKGTRSGEYVLGVVTGLLIGIALCWGAMSAMGP